MLKYLVGQHKYSRKLQVLPLLIYMLKCPPMVHESEQLMMWNPTGTSCLFVGSSVRRAQGAFGFQLSPVSHRWGQGSVGLGTASPIPADPAAPGKVKPVLCSGFSLCFSWDSSFAPIPCTLSFLQRAIPYSFWAKSQKHWDDKKSGKRVALILVSLGTLSVEIRENKPPKYLKKMTKKLLMKSYSSLSWTEIFIINVIYFNSFMI